MKKLEFLKRCETIFDMGLADEKNFWLLREWLDNLMRYEHTQFSYGQSQGKNWLEFLNAEYKRTEQGTRTLAADHQGYALQQIAAVLAHTCQLCAEDKDAWHTRTGFCQHHSQDMEGF